MNANMTEDTQDKRTPDKRRRRGTVIILVVGALTLLIIITTAYIQVARWDRIATSQVTTNNVEMVANAMLAYVQQILGDDLLDSPPVAANAKFFNPDPNPVTSPGGDSRPGSCSRWS